MVEIILEVVTIHVWAHDYARCTGGEAARNCQQCDMYQLHLPIHPRGFGRNVNISCDLYHNCIISFFRNLVFSFVVLCGEPNSDNTLRPFV
jgi:hypothetical protein